MANIEVVVLIRKLENDGSYTEWQARPGFNAFNAKAKKEIQQMIGVTGANYERI
jgi:hypothetical protein